MSFKHGVYTSEVPTSIIPPAASEASLPVVFGVAPINMTDLTNVNKPVLCYNYADAALAMGVSKSFGKFNLSEFIYSQFALFVVGPCVLVNVLDPEEHKATVTAEVQSLVSDKIKLVNEGVLPDSVVVKNKAGTVTYQLLADYGRSFDDLGFMVITRAEDGAIPENAELTVTYDYLDPSLVTSADIIGGIDVATGKKTGLELINDVFPRFGLVPAQIAAPGYSLDPAVAAVMKAKAQNINAHFKAISITDIDTTEVKKYQDVSAWKNQNNYTSPFEVVCFPKLKLGNDVFNMSTQLVGLICQTDALNDGVPYVSPSNKSFQANGAVIDDGSEVWLGPENAAYLNSQGVVTALNFIGGWKCWGNQMACYPANTDPKDQFIPLRRMFNWIANTLVLTFWQKVDAPGNKRLVQSVVDSCNIWLNGLAARQYTLGGRVEFLESENPLTDLMSGIYRFHVYVTPPTPAQEIDFILEYDPQYLQTLF